MSFWDFFVRQPAGVSGRVSTAAAKKYDERYEALINDLERRLVQLDQEYRLVKIHDTSHNRSGDDPTRD